MRVPQKTKSIPLFKLVRAERPKSEHLDFKRDTTNHADTQGNSQGQRCYLSTKEQGRKSQVLQTLVPKVERIPCQSRCTSAQCTVLDTFGAIYGRYSINGISRKT